MEFILATIIIVIICAAAFQAIKAQGGRRSVDGPRLMPAPLDAPPHVPSMAELRASVVLIAGEGDYYHEVVGESHYQDELEEIVGGRSDESAEFEAFAILTPEPTNQYDPGAIAVVIDGHTVGYLSRADNKALAQAIAKAGVQGRPVMAGAMVVGGWDRGGGDRGSFGVRLDIPEDIEFKPLPT